MFSPSRLAREDSPIYRNYIQPVLDAEKGREIKTVELLLRLWRMVYENKDIAETVSLSKSSVLNIFHKNIHTSPIHYLVHYRLKHAAKLLAATQVSVSAIAHDTGFENTGYFCRKFKETFQMTPGEYRKREERKINEKRQDTGNGKVIPAGDDAG